MIEDRTYPPNILTFLLGGLAGASLALLLAPNSGRDTRRAVGRRVRGSVSAARDLKDRIARRGSELRDEASRTMEQVADDAEDVAARLGESARAGVARVGEAARAERPAL